MEIVFDIEFDPFDVEPLCSNCKYDGPDYSCFSEKRKVDIQNGVKKISETGICPYFEVQDWIKREQEKFKS